MTQDRYKEFREEREIAGTGKKTPEGLVPEGVAGFIVGECTTLCYGCGLNHPDVTSHEPDTELHAYSYDYISCMSEWDYPGATCENCHKTLDTNIIFND